MDVVEDCAGASGDCVGAAEGGTGAVEDCTGGVEGQESSEVEVEPVAELGADTDFGDDSQELEIAAGKRLALTTRISSLLFVATKPLTVEQLSQSCGARAERVEKALEDVASLFDEQVHGFSLKQAAGCWQFRTIPAAATYIHRLIPKTARRLSRAAAETLAVIAYKQPVQRAEIEAIRGVDALPTLKTLIDAKLIRIVGREQSAGHPALYGTTKTFLEKFGLSDLSELPSSKELSQFFEEPGDVVEGVEEGEDGIIDNEVIDDEMIDAAASTREENEAAPSTIT